MGNSDYSVRLPDGFVKDLVAHYPAATSVPDAIRMASQEAMHTKRNVILETEIRL